MEVRYNKELGLVLKKLMERLLANQTLLKLLYYKDNDPLSKPDLTEQQKKEEVFQELIKIVPKFTREENERAAVSIRVIKARNTKNPEFDYIEIGIESIVPLDQWIIKDINLRPFMIMSEIEKSLANKSVNGLGHLRYVGFDLTFLTEEASCYEQLFEVDSYD